MRGLALVLTLVLAIPAPAPVAQEESDRAPVPSDLTEEVEVRLVTLPILVTDKKGRPITDLDVAEVEIKENGEKRKVAFLDAFRTRDSVPPDPSAPAPEPGRPATLRVVPGTGPEIRRVVFLFDARHSRLPNRLRWAAGALKWVRDEMQPNDVVALAVFDGGVRYQVPFTGNKGLLETSLKDPYFLEGFHFDRREQVSDLMESLTTCDEAFDQMNCATIAVETHLFEWEQETKRITAALRSFAASLGAIPGRKMVIYGSEGFIRDPGNVATNAIIAEFGTEKVNWSAMQSRLRLDLNQDVMRLFGVGAAAETAFFPIDVRSIADRDWVSDAGEEFQLHERQLVNPMADVFDSSRNALGSLANATGGRAYFGADAAQKISDAIASFKGLYTVGYYGDPAVALSRDVKVKIKRKNVRVSDPSGAAPARPPRPLPAEIGILKPVPDGHRALVPVGVELDLTLIPFERGEGNTHNTQLSVYAALLDDAGGIAGEAFELVDVSLDEKQFGQRAVLPFRHIVKVGVQPGRYRVRVRVTDKDLTVRADRVLPQEIQVGPGSAAPVEATAAPKS